MSLRRKMRQACGILRPGVWRGRAVRGADLRDAKFKQFGEASPMTRIFVQVFCGLALSSGLVAAQQPAGEPIKVGAVLSLTGPGAGLGGPERNGILLAVK